MHELALGGEYVPSMQSIQAIELRLEYLPARHEVHWLAPVALFVWKPAVQFRHLSVIATGVYVPFGQLRHSSLLYVYWPALQLAHFRRLESLNSPTGHSSQASVYACSAASVPSSSM